jgi:cysteine-S-conjugate beta-lyase
MGLIDNWMVDGYNAHMQSYNFDQLPDRYASECVKWHFFEQDVLPMWVADMDFTTPPEVTQALHTRVEHGVFGYAEHVKGLAEAILAWLEASYNWRITVEDLVLLPGVVVGINLAAQTLAESGKGILIQTPVYPPFFGVSKNASIPSRESALYYQDNDRYLVDWDRFESDLDKACGQFLLCNPHNPVGRVFEQIELERMAEACLRRGISICSDEIHSDLVYTGNRHIPIASLNTEIAANTITLMAPSKTFNIPGLECSFAVIQNPELRRRFKQTRRGIVGGVNLLGMVAAKVAYQEGRPWLDQLLVYLEENRNLVYDFVQKKMPGLRMFMPEGTYLAWLDCRDLGLEVTPCQFFVDHARVGLNDGRIFGAGGEGYVRLNFGCPRSLLVEGLTRMAAALEENLR